MVGFPILIVVIALSVSWIIKHNYQKKQNKRVSEGLNQKNSKRYSIELTMFILKNVALVIIVIFLLYKNYNL